MILRISCSFLLFVQLLAAPALHALPGDAGGPGDAPNQMALAQGPLQPGTHNGTAIRGVDESDWYWFEAPPRHVLWLSFDRPATAGLRLELFGPNDLEPNPAAPFVEIGFTSSVGPAPFVLHTAGAWALHVTYHWSDPNLPGAVHDYAFRFWFEPARTLVVFTTHDPVAHFEARWAAPTEVRITLSYGVEGRLDRPNAFVYFPQFAGAWPPPVIDGSNGNSMTGFEDGVTLQGHGLPQEVAIPLPEAGEAIPVHAATGAHRMRLAGTVTDASLRISAAAEAANVVLRVAIEADRAFEYAAWTSSEVVVHRYGETADDFVGLPGYAAAGTHQLDLDVEGRFVGIARPSPGGTMDYRRPGGDWQAAPERLLLRDLRAGLWSFRYGGDATTAQSSPYELMGAFVPELGLFGGPPQPLP